MQVKIIRIGNSQGIRIPKSMLEQVGLSGVADLAVEDGKIVLQPPQKHPRAGWDEAFAGSSQELSEEDRDWIEADLTDDKDWTW
jgi:antitoxin MazE